MISYLDRAFCASPNCKNACGRQLTEEIMEGAKKWWDGCDGEAPIAVGYFCGEVNDD